MMLTQNDLKGLFNQDGLAKCVSMAAPIGESGLEAQSPELKL